MRDVPIDEVFTWKEEFVVKAREAFGCQDVDVSPSTYADLKQRCDKIEREIDPFFENCRSLLPYSLPFNGITIHVVKVGEVPDGVLRGCTRRVESRNT